MRLFAIVLLLAGLAACSPRTDISSTSTEGVALRTHFDVVAEQQQNGVLTAKLKAAQWARGMNNAEDFVRQRYREGYQAIHVQVYGPQDAINGRPRGQVDWSPATGVVRTIGSQ